jgi:hypothetical protein
VGSYLTFSLKLAGLPADAVLEVRLPSEAGAVAPDDFLEWVFPFDEEGRNILQESFDPADNPDLPEIYDSFLTVVEQSRAGLCRIAVSSPTGSDEAAGVPSDLLAKGHALQSAGNVPLLLTPVYDALEYAAEQGHDAGEADLTEWLQLGAAIYFLDRHEAPLPTPGSPDDDSGIKRVAARVLSLGLAGISDDGARTEITAAGRRFIGRLLAETETYIDRYNIFNDVVWDEDSEQALFGTGHGDDLRVETFIAEAIDPVRAVFLLRLYDGTLDEYVDDWENLLASREFYNRILEPVVNRSITPADLLEEIVDQGLSLLEAARQLEAEREANSRIARTVPFHFPSPPDGGGLG